MKVDLLNKDIGYIRLTSFNENSSQQINKKINELEKNKKVKSYILDLRNNPGGLLSQQLKLLTIF